MPYRDLIKASPLDLASSRQLRLLDARVARVTSHGHLIGLNGLIGGRRRDEMMIDVAPVLTMESAGMERAGTRAGATETGLRATVAMPLIVAGKTHTRVEESGIETIAADTTIAIEVATDPRTTMTVAKMRERAAAQDMRTRTAALATVGEATIGVTTMIDGVATRMHRGEMTEIDRTGRRHRSEAATIAEPSEPVATVGTVDEVGSWTVRMLLVGEMTEACEKIPRGGLERGTLEMSVRGMTEIQFQSDVEHTDRRVHPEPKTVDKEELHAHLEELQPNAAQPTFE